MGRRLVLRVDRFWAKVDRRGPDECWPWLGALGNGGRGLFVMEHGHTMTAPRAAYVFTRGGIAKKWKFVCHSCDNPLCCNPSHLFLSDASGNQQDYWRKVRSGKLPPKRSRARVRGAGVRKRGETWQANVTHKRRTYWRTFQGDTPIETIQQWRQATLDSLKEREDLINRHVAPSPASAASVSSAPESA